MLIYILLKKLWENIPPHVNMCITGAICVAHRDWQDLLCWCSQEGTGTLLTALGRVQLCPDPLPGLQQQGGKVPTAAGAGRGAVLLAAHSAPCRAALSPAPDG